MWGSRIKSPGHYKLVSLFSRASIMLKVGIFFVFFFVGSTYAGGACETTEDCVAPNVCSKWGWCQWTKVFLSNCSNMLICSKTFNKPRKLQYFGGKINSIRNWQNFSPILRILRKLKPRLRKLEGCDNFPEIM